jgi:hypothetical protein
VKFPNGPVELPNGSVEFPNGPVKFPYGSVKFPNGPVAVALDSPVDSGIDHEDVVDASTKLLDEFEAVTMDEDEDVLLESEEVVDDMIEELLLDVMFFFGGTTFCANGSVFVHLDRVRRNLTL